MSWRIWKSDCDLSMKPVTKQILLEKSTVGVFGYLNANTFLEEWKVPKNEIWYAFDQCPG